MTDNPLIYRNKQQPAIDTYNEITLKLPTVAE